MKRLPHTPVLAFLVAAVLVPAPAAAGGGCHPERVTDAAVDAVRMEAGCFVPMVARVPVGGTLRFDNADPTPHTATGVGGSFGSYDLVDAGAAVTATFDEPGVFPYVCTLHPLMVGTVVVGDGLPSASSAAAPDGGSAARGVDGLGVLSAGALGALAAAVLLVGALRALGRRRSPRPLQS